MYTYDILCYGHQLDRNKQLISMLSDELIEREYDMEFSLKINNHKFSFEQTYNGNDDEPHLLLGVEIADSNNNLDYIKTVRSVKEEDYESSYLLFVSELLKYLKSELDNEVLINEFEQFIETTEPCFYSIQVSS